ncbi:MAG: hypothetical protein ACYC4L_19320 [Chloroflexota bacterium]
MRLHEIGAWQRTIIVWAAFVAALWSAFALAGLAHPAAFSGVVGTVEAGAPTGWALFAFIAATSSLVMRRRLHQPLRQTGRRGHSRQAPRCRRGGGNAGLLRTAGPGRARPAVAIPGFYAARRPCSLG